MLKGSGREAAGVASQQQVDSRPGAPASQSRDDLWKDVPGFAAGDSWISAERGAANGGAANRGAEQGSRGDEAGRRKGGVLWQPRDPWRDEVVSPAAGAATGAGSEQANRESDGVDEAIRGFNNDPAAAGPVSNGPPLSL